MTKHYNTVKLKLLKLEPDSYHIIIKAHIEKTLIRMIVDTGASHSCFDINFIKSLHQEAEIIDNESLNVSISSDNFESKISVVRQLRIGKTYFREYQAVLVDLQYINDAYKTLGLPKIEGILGSDFFTRFSVVIDYEKLELRIGKKRK